jgi:anti-sigma regulatory factor (Ser/Thr protein kinase)
LSSIVAIRIRRDPPLLWSAPIGCEPQQLIEARTAVRRLLGRHGTPHAVDDVCLVVTELLTNGLLHTSGHGLQLTVLCLPDHVRIEVAGPGTDNRIAPVEPSLTRGGFGLHIVDALTDAWGVRPGPTTVVWATIATT